MTRCIENTLGIRFDNGCGCKEGFGFGVGVYPFELLVHWLFIENKDWGNNTLDPLFILPRFSNKKVDW